MRCFVSPILQSVDVLWGAFAIFVSVVHMVFEGKDVEGVKAATHQLKVRK